MLKSMGFPNLLIVRQARAKLGRKETYHGGDDRDDDGTTTPTLNARPPGNEEERRICVIVLRELERRWKVEGGGERSVVLTLTKRPEVKVAEVGYLSERPEDYYRALV